MRFVGVIASISKGFSELQKKIGEDDRSIMSIEFKNLNNYGCWCYFDDDVGNGKGLPKDPIDEFCRDLHRSYECAVAEIPGCIPWQVQTATAEALVEAFGGILPACQVLISAPVAGGAANVPCSVAACAAETKFVSSVSGYLVNFDAFFHNLTHVGVAWADKKGNNGVGEFNPERQCYAECPRGGCVSDKDDRQCCGVMPERYPFKVHSGHTGIEQACCAEEEVYNIATHNCVAGEVVKK